MPLWLYCRIYINMYTIVVALCLKRCVIIFNISHYILNFINISIYWFIDIYYVMCLITHALVPHCTLMIDHVFYMNIISSYIMLSWSDSLMLMLKFTFTIKSFIYIYVALVLLQGRSSLSSEATQRRCWRRRMNVEGGSGFVNISANCSSSIALWFVVVQCIATMFSCKRRHLPTNVSYIYLI